MDKRRGNYYIIGGVAYLLWYTGDKGILQQVQSVYYRGGGVVNNVLQVSSRPVRAETGIHHMVVG